MDFRSFPSVYGVYFCVSILGIRLPTHSTDDCYIVRSTIRTSDNLAVLRRCVMTTMITEHRIEIYTLIEAHFHTAFNDSLQTRKVCRIVNTDILDHLYSELFATQFPIFSYLPIIANGIRLYHKPLIMVSHRFHPLGCTTFRFSR